MSNTPFNPQRGNALFLILIAVVLFAALSVAITRSGTGSASPREGYAVSYAEITSNMNTIAASLNRAFANGCALEDIDFETDDLATTPLAAGTNNKCIIFNTRGGDAPVIYGKADPTKIAYGIDTVNVPGIGSNTKNDVVVYADMEVIGMKEPICQYINERQNIPVVDTVSNWSHFATTLDPSTGLFAWAGLSADYNGKATGCFLSGTDPKAYTVAIEQ